MLCKITKALQNNKDVSISLCLRLALSKDIYKSYININIYIYSLILYFVEHFQRYQHQLGRAGNVFSVKILWNTISFSQKK